MLPCDVDVVSLATTAIESATRCGSRVLALRVHLSRRKLAASGYSEMGYTFSSCCAFPIWANTTLSDVASRFRSYVRSIFLVTLAIHWLELVVRSELVAMSVEENAFFGSKWTMEEVYK